VKPWLRRALPWALYDWANSAFATTVMAAFVPILNKDLWSRGVDETVSTFRLGLAGSIAAIIVALMAPVLGSFADAGGAKKRFLGFFAYLGVAATAALGFAGEGQWAIALPLFVLGWIGFAGANVFYDSLLVNVADRDRFDIVSALGYSLGYVGGGLLFVVNVAMNLRPELFGFSNAGQAVTATFISVACWWGLFSLPLLFKVDEPRPKNALGIRESVGKGLTQLLHTFHEIRRLRVVALFLLAYWLYIDGVDTVIQMAVDYGKALEFDSSSLMIALAITQFVGFPAALVFGRIGEKLGAKAGIFIGLAVYLGVCLWGYRMTNVRQFYALAVVVGLVQGGVQSLSRSLYARLIPADKSAEFFGFYNMLGKFAAVIGPALMGVAAVRSGNPRMGILAIIPLFVIGGALLAVVRPSQKPA